MKPPITRSAALLGVCCWLLTSITWSAVLRDYALSDDAPLAADTTQSLSDNQDIADFTAGTCPVQCCCYRWQAWADALFMTRDIGGGQSLAFGDPGDPKGSEVFNSDEMDFDFAWGPSIGLFRCLSPYTSVGVEFYALDGWSTEDQVDGDVSVQFPSFPFLPDGGYGLATFRYESQLYNTEINLRHRVARTDWLTLLAGFRWIELGEEFGTTFETGGTTPNFLIDVNNHLYGFQLGALANLKSRGPWSLDGWIKAGIYGNSASQETTEDFTSVGGEMTYISARDTNVAFAGDIGITLQRQITQRLSARVGYMALWVEGVALAPEQLDNSDPSSGTATLDHSDGVLYHGGFAGLEYKW